MTQSSYRLNALILIAAALMCAADPVLSQEPEVPDPILVSLQARLERELVDLSPAAKFEIPDSYGGKSLIVRYQTRNYMVYPAGKAGRLGRKLVEEEGPDDEGILVRIHFQAEGELNQAVVPQTIRSPYWMTYLNVYPVPGSDKQIYIALSYRGWTDKKLILKIQRIVGHGVAGSAASGGDKHSEGEKKPEPPSE